MGYQQGSLSGGPIKLDDIWPSDVPAFCLIINTISIDVFLPLVELVLFKSTHPHVVVWASVVSVCLVRTNILRPETAVTYVDASFFIAIFFL